MQQSLIKAIKDINHFIFATNTNNNMATPKLADDTITNAGSNKNPRVHYNRLADGTHATSETNLKWASKIINTIEENRTRHFKYLQIQCKWITLLASVLFFLF